MFDFAIIRRPSAFLVGVQEAVPMLCDGGRIIAMTYAPGGRFGQLAAVGGHGARLRRHWSLWCRYFAVALAPRQITVNAISPGWTKTAS